MARFRLEAGQEEKELGRLILELAETRDEKARATLESRIRDLVDSDSKKKLKFVYDTNDEVHVVVPYLGDRKYSGNDLAHEAMGSISLRGCGK